MPVYNRDKYVEQTIKSVLSQTYTNFRFLISDNGSTDNTSSICLHYESVDDRITYIRQDKNIGMVSNIQLLIDKCDTEYFMLIASDDIIDTNWIEVLLKEISSSDSACIGATGYIDSKCNEISGASRSFSYLSRFRVIRRIKFIFNLNPLIIFSIFKTNSIKRDWVEILGHRQNGEVRFRSAGDVYMCYEYLKNNKVRFVNYTKRYSRIHGGNTHDFDDDKRVNKKNIITHFKEAFTTLDYKYIFINSSTIEKTIIPAVYILITARNIYELVVIATKRIIK